MPRIARPDNHTVDESDGRTSAGERKEIRCLKVDVLQVECKVF
jgi:hypothetical protein